MNTRTLAVIAAFTAALVLVAALTVLSGGAGGDGLPARLVPDLYDRSGQIQRLRIESAGGVIVLERDRGDEADEADSGGERAERWRLAEPYGGYPADPARVGAALRTIAELEPAGRRTANPENHALLGVQDVDESESRPSGTVRVTLSGPGGATLADLVLGRTSDAGGRYARRVGEDQSWLTQGPAGVPDSPRRYLPSPVLEIPARRIVSIRLDPAGGEGFTIRRNPRRQRPDQAGDADTAAETPPETEPETEPPFRIEGLPEGAELVDDANETLSRIVASLSFVTPRDVRPADDAPSDPDTTSYAVVRTDDGLALAIAITPAPAEDGGGNGAWVRISPSREPTSGDAAAEDAGGTAAAPDSVGITDAAFNALQRRLEGWALRLSGPLVDRLRTTADDITIEQAPPGAAPLPPTR